MPSRLFILALTLGTAFCARAQQPSDWQQHVAYQIDVTLQADLHRVKGHQILRYDNNSPDTLREVFYHLYFNAFNPHSMMAERNRHLPDPDRRIVPRIFELNEDEIGFHRIRSLRQDGVPVTFEIHDTVMKVHLARPIPPGGRTEFEMDFTSQVPLQTRRSGRDNREGIDYSMSQWYPKLANYDERGWHADAYIGREFYAPFGSFDVRITLPSEYVIGATGVLQNPAEVGHGYGDAETPDADSLTWHFHAENVHDFAWAADPDYVHEVVEGDDGVTYHLLYQANVAEKWEKMKEWVPQIIQFYSRQFGRYPYPQFTVAQAGDGGMEYPMMTLIVGDIPPAALRGTTAHEAGHMWYYGVLASNESDYAWMDEGFASYAETEFSAHFQNRPPSHVGTRLGIVRQQQVDLVERMNTPSDWFETNIAYSVAAYTGGEMLLDMLGYVISDTLRDRFLLEYFDRFKFRHPDPHDVEKVAEDVSGLHLDWYFDEVINTTWTVDYAVDDLESRRTADGWETTIELERGGRGVLPVDLKLTLEDGSEQWVNVPLVVMQGHKPLPEGWIVSEPWPWTSPEHTLRLRLPSRAVKAEIDPLLRTPDMNRLDNSTRFPIRFTFMKPPASSWSAYHVGWRPLVEYADRFGPGLGLQFRGTYLFGRYRTKATIKLWPEVLFSSGEEPPLAFPAYFLDELSAFDGVDFDFALSDQIDRLGTYTIASLRSRKHLGIVQNEASISFLLAKAGLLRSGSRNLTLSAVHQDRVSDRATDTFVASGFSTEPIVSFSAELSDSGPMHRYLMGVETGSSLRRGGHSANRFVADLARAVPLASFTGALRLKIGLGSDALAVQKLFRLGSASFEDRWENAAYRSAGEIFGNPLNEAHWVAFEGPGPVAYLRRVDGFASVPAAPRLFAAGIRLLSPPVAEPALLRPLRFELFAGAGRMWRARNVCADLCILGGENLDELIADAGVGLQYDLSDLPLLRRWVLQSDVLSGLKLRARFPVWASHPEFTDSPDDAIAFRWLLGVSLDELPWE